MRFVGKGLPTLTICRYVHDVPAPADPDGGEVAAIGTRQHLRRQDGIRIPIAQQATVGEQ